MAENTKIEWADLTDEKIADLLGRITPGPWRAVATGGADDFDEVFADDLEKSVADAEGANAEAIALVPELLAEVARLRAEQAATKADKPDWEGFGRAVMDAWPEGGIDGFELQDFAEKYGLIRKVEGGFNPDVHRDEFGCAEPGDEWFQLTYRP